MHTAIVWMHSIPAFHQTQNEARDGCRQHYLLDCDVCTNAFYFIYASSSVHHEVLIKIIRPPVVGVWMGIRRTASLSPRLLWRDAICRARLQLHSRSRAKIISTEENYTLALGRRVIKSKRFQPSRVCVRVCVLCARRYRCCYYYYFMHGNSNNGAHQHGERCAPDCHLSALRLHWHMQSTPTGLPWAMGAVKAASKSQVHSLSLSLSLLASVS